MKKRIIKIVFLALSITSFSEEISLDKAVEMALENNSEIKIKKLEIESKKNSLISEKSLYYPNLKAASSISKAENSDSNYGSSITLSQSLFRGGEIKSSVDIAELNLKLIEEELKEINTTKALETINIFISVLKFENQIKVYKNSLEELKKEYEKEKIKYEKNMSSKLDIMSIEISISSAEEKIYIAESDYKNAVEKLKKNIGYKNSTEIKIAPSELKSYSINLEEDIKNYMSNSIYTKKKEIEKAIYKKEITASNSAYYPDINLSLSYNSKQNSFDEWDLKGSIGFEYTIYDFGKRKATSSNAKIDLKKYEIERKNDIEDKVVEIKTKYEEILAYEKVLKSKKEKLKKIEEKFEITKIKYENRYIGSDDYLKDENELQQSRVDILNSELELMYKYNEYKNLLQ